MDERLAGLGSALASLMFLWAMIHQYFPNHFQSSLFKYSRRLVSLVYPYVEITFPEYAGGRMKRSEAYRAIESYLTSTCSQAASKLKAEVGKDSDSLVLSMDDHEEVTDAFHGKKLWWSSVKHATSSQVISWYPAQEDRRYYKLTFHRRHRDLVVGSYLAHVLRQGKEVAIRNRQRRLHTNNSSQSWSGYKQKVWSHVVFEHPASFDTLAMDPAKKREIMEDLIAFRKGKDYYAKIGKAWKRGYLLYGPPGTGKSSMVAAIANFLDYDIYDLELTAVKNNTELRKLLIETTSKSVIVVEDVDCSLDLTGKRKPKPKKEGEGEEVPKPGAEEKDESSKVTLSGLLNFIDGLWSACGGERLIVFTTNHIEKLDPALIRRGRMDKHIEMSYCRFEAFRVLAKNYLDLEDHRLFESVWLLMEEVDMTPADVAESLMPKSPKEDADKCMGKLIEALMRAKEEGAQKDREQGEEEITSAVDGDGEGEVEQTQEVKI